MKIMEILVKTERYDVFGTKVTRISPKRFKRLNRKYYIFPLDLEVKLIAVPVGFNKPRVGTPTYVFRGNRNIFNFCANYEILFYNPKNSFMHLIEYGIFNLTKNKCFRHIETSLFISDVNYNKNCYLMFNTKRDLSKFKLSYGENP